MRVCGTPLSNACTLNLFYIAPFLHNLPLFYVIMRAIKYSAKDTSRGHLPQLSTVEVVRRPEGYVDEPPPHMKPSTIPFQSKIDYIPPGTPIPPKYVPLVTFLEGQPFDNDYKGRPILAKARQSICSVNANEMYMYSVHASQWHGYWFRVYQDAKSHAELTVDRKHPVEEVRALAQSELSQEELFSVQSSIVGLEVIQNHTPQETWGVVVDYQFTDGHANLDVLIRPFDSRKGRATCLVIETGAVCSCSLSHARLGDKLQLHEVSICPQGARPGTYLQHVVKMTENDVLYYHPRLYVAPVFMMSATLQQRSRNSEKGNPYLQLGGDTDYSSAVPEAAWTPYDYSHHYLTHHVGDCTWIPATTPTQYDRALNGTTTTGDREDQVMFGPLRYGDCGLVNVTTDTGFAQHLGRWLRILRERQASLKFHARRSHFIRW